jgi:hypothetical protein
MKMIQLEPYTSFDRKFRNELRNCASMFDKIKISESLYKDIVRTGKRFDTPIFKGQKGLYTVGAKGNEYYLIPLSAGCLKQKGIVIKRKVKSLHV